MVHPEVRALNPILDAHTSLEATFGTNISIGTPTGIRSGLKLQSVLSHRFARMLARLVMELSYSTSQTTELAVVI